ncbi:hypothetical protein FHX69_6639 [Prauserella muralis]|nr:hypothetical protein FHX69_6639 [Prauserella muralis]
MALTAGLLFAPAASADEPQNSAFALAASGLISIDPTPAVDDSNGASEDSVVEVADPKGLLKANVLNARAGDGYAKSSVADLRLDLSPLGDLGLSKPLLTATAIEARCDDGEVSSSLAAANLGGTPLDVAAPPNTGVDVPGVASVVLNKQTENPDGSTTVTAISIKVNKLQTIDIASATCAEGSTPTQPPGEPTTPPDNGDDGDGGSGGQANPDGSAPVPTPVEGHLDVTG